MAEAEREGTDGERGLERKLANVEDLKSYYDVWQYIL